MSSAITLPRNTPPSVAEKLANMGNSLARYREAAREEGVIIGRTVTAAVTGAALGFTKGRYETTEVKGVPVAAGVAVLAKVGGYLMGRRDQMSTFAHAAGDAAGWSGVYECATEFGADQRAKAKGAKTSGFSRLGLRG